LKRSFKMFNKRAVLNRSIAAAMLVASGSAIAATTTVIPVSASVPQTCTFKTGTVGLAFGAYDPIGANAVSPLLATGSVKVACAKNSTGLTIDMGVSANPGGSTARQMISGTDLLEYNVFQPSVVTATGATCSAGTTAWVSGTPMAIANAPSKAERTYEVCGSIAGGQDAAVSGSYADSLTATINF